MNSDYEPIDGEERRPRPLRTALIIAALAFVGGLVAMGWILTHWDRARSVLPGQQAAAPPAAVAALAQPGRPETAIDTPATLQDAAGSAVLNARVADLEARIARVSERAQAASGNAARAEGLLIAFAARRALDRGMTLGYIEAQLNARFGASQPRAVAIVIAAARDPVTIGELQIGLEDLAPTLSSASDDEGWWTGLKREMAELVVIRKAGTPSPLPAQRLRRAQRMLEGGRVDAALAEIARMPGRERAANWMKAARQYNEARRALDVIETAAILEPAAAAHAPVVPEPTPPAGEGGL